MKPKKSYRFGGSSGHHNLMMANLTASLIIHGKVKTTEAKAKLVKPLVDHMVMLGKKGDLAARRQALSELRNEDAVHKLFAEIAPRYENRNSGFTRSVKVGFRQGDSAPVVQLELIEK